MNINHAHPSDKMLSTASLFKSNGSQVIAIQILKDGILKEHKTAVPAMLICVSGEVVFENEAHVKETLHTGDYMLIDADIKHWVQGISDAQLVLIK